MRFAKVYLEITNRCNLSCAFCPGTKRAPGLLTTAQFEALLGKLQGYTEYLYFHLMGEPLLHPALEELLRMAGERGFRVIITTNGTLLERCEDVLLHAKALHKVNVSLHSFEANNTGDFIGYVSSCCTFAKRAAEAGILMNLRLWNLDGQEAVGLNARNDELLAIIEAAFPKPWRETRGGYRLAERIYLAPAERFSWPSLDERDRGERRFCYGLRDQIGVLCDGTVVPCCLDHEGDVPLGNLLQEDLYAILEKPRTKTILEGFDRQRAVEPLCRRCGYSMRFLKK